MSDQKKRKRFFSRHAKSSAAFVSLGIHAVFIVVAVSFVAVKVIQKDDTEFEAKPITRPKMTLKKLQVPVTVKKKRPKPKLRKRIVAKPRKRAMPDIRMPEVTGVKGGLGNSSGSGLGGAGGVGFSIPEIQVFGVKSRGEKVFIILDAAEDMMYDEMGGIPSYTIIKEELVRILDGLPMTALFNITVHDKWNTYVLFPKMVPANEANVKKLEAWLKPLNAVRPGMGVNEWGPKTLGPGGTRFDEDVRTGKFSGKEHQESWHPSLVLAMQQQADTVFILPAWWGYQRAAKGERDQAWYQTADGKRYLETYQKALVKLEEDNARRREKGMPPRAISRNDKRHMVKTYFPDTALPPEPEFHYYKPEDYIEQMLEVRQKFQPESFNRSSGLSKKRMGGNLTVNVVRFARADGERTRFRDERTVDNFKRLAGFFKGKYRELAGLEAIQSQVDAGR